MAHHQQTYTCASVGVAIFTATIGCLLAGGHKGVDAFNGYDSSYAFMELRKAGEETAAAKLCVNHQAWRYQQLPETANDAPKLFIGWWGGEYNQTDLCTVNRSPFDHGKLVPAHYQTNGTTELGVCRQRGMSVPGSRLARFQVNLAKANSVSQLLFLVDKGKDNYFNSTDYLFQTFYNPELKQNDSVSVFYMYRDVFIYRLLPLLVDDRQPIGPEAAATELRIYRPVSWLPIDASVIVLWAVALGCILVGSTWSAGVQRGVIKRRFSVHTHESGGGGAAVDGTGGRGDYQTENTDVSTGTGTTTRGTATTVTTSSSNGVFGGTTTETSAIVPMQSSDLDEGRDVRQAGGGGQKSAKTDQADLIPLMSVCSHCLSVALVLIFVVSLLMLVYFVRSPMIIFFNVALALGGCYCVHGCLYKGVFQYLADGWDLDLFSLGQLCCCCFTRDRGPRLLRGLAARRCWRSPFRLGSVLVFALAVVLCATWFFTRQQAYNYRQLDAINICVCIYAIHRANIRSMRLLIFLMMAMLVYDFFMVFGTRMLGGCSVMLEVVTGTECAPQQTQNGTAIQYYPTPPFLTPWVEKIPLLFNVPLLSDPMGECIDLGVEREFRHVMLGLGDVIIPGYFVAFCFWLDVAKAAPRRTVRWLYRSIALIGYTVGMALTFVVLKLMRSGQPALLYIIPCTLGPVVVCAWLDGILGTLWSGENRVALEEDGDGGGVKKFRQDGGEKDETNENNVDGQTVATAAANTSSIFISPV